jgi:hypothetical protein
VEFSAVPGPPAIGSLSGKWLTPDRQADFALPTIQNFLGHAQVAWGPTGLHNWVMPPTGLAVPNGLLYTLDERGRPARVGPEGTSYRWRPWEVLRRHPVVSSQLRLHWAEPAVTERLTFSRGGSVALLFGGYCRTWRFGSYWNLPPQDDPQLRASWDGEWVNVEDSKTFGIARFRPSRAPARVRTYAGIDDFYSRRPLDGPGWLVALEWDLEPGAELAWTSIQGTRPGETPLGDDSNVEAEWDRVWADAFTPDNPTFSGHLPALDLGDEALNRLYYMGVLSLLNSRRLIRPAHDRDRYVTGGQAIWTSAGQPLSPFYTTGATDGAPTTSFLWDLQFQSPLLARLDPDVLRAQLEAFLRADMSGSWGIEQLTGEPVGMWYGANDGAIVSAARAYVDGTGDHDWLDMRIDDRTVRELLLRHVLNHEKLRGRSVLADYGTSEHLLECVSSYEHEVAAFNALAAWCYRYAAEVLAPDRAGELVDRAERVEHAVVELLRPDGVFECRGPGGPRIVRTALDFIYVATYMTHALDETARKSMLAFFVDELETTDWMLALSETDPDSRTDKLPHFQTYRADHQSTGSWDGWPGLAAAARIALGDGAATIDWLRRISAVTWEGPFGQAHYVGTGDNARGRPATKASFINGNCYLGACGATLSTTLLTRFHE